MMLRGSVIPPDDWTSARDLDVGDPILGASRALCPGFDIWLAKAQAERRPALIVRDERGIRGLVIVKLESESMKLCSLTVRDDARNQGLGTALARAAVAYAKRHGIARTWATSHADPAALAALAAAGLGVEDRWTQAEFVVAYPLDRLGAVRLFHEAFEQTVASAFGWHDDALRHGLREEELREVAESLRAGDLVGSAGELADLAYVSYGDAVACGFHLATPPAPADLVSPRVPDDVEALISRLEAACAAVRQVWRMANQATTESAYVTLITTIEDVASACGIELAPVFAEIERANLLKEAVPGGKARKPAGWTPPRLAMIVDTQIESRGG